MVFATATNISCALSPLNFRTKLSSHTHISIGSMFPYPKIDPEAWIHAKETTPFCIFTEDKL